MDFESSIRYPHIALAYLFFISFSLIFGSAWDESLFVC